MGNTHLFAVESMQCNEGPYVACGVGLVILDVVFVYIIFTLIWHRSTT